MTKLSLTFLLIIAIAGAAASSDGLRAQSSTSIEYLRVAPHLVSHQSGRRVTWHTNYRACLATTGPLDCRDFGGSSDHTILAMLATLGAEGWELVSATIEDPERRGLTYIFKRQARFVP